MRSIRHGLTESEIVQVSKRKMEAEAGTTSMLQYPVVFEPDDNGTVLVSFQMFLKPTRLARTKMMR